MLWTKEKLYAIEKNRVIPTRKSKKTVQRNQKIQLSWNLLSAQKMAIDDVIEYLALFEEYESKRYFSLNKILHAVNFFVFLQL